LAKRWKNATITIAFFMSKKSTASGISMVEVPKPTTVATTAMVKAHIRNGIIIFESSL
jgi:predicted Na+-dependent transporter